MSWATIAPAVKVAIGLAVPVTGWDDRQRPFEELAADEYPRAMLYGYSERNRQLDFQQIEVARSFTVELWMQGATEASLAQRVELVRAGIQDTSWSASPEVDSITMVGAVLGLHKDKAIGVAIMDFDVVEVYV